MLWENLKKKLPINAVYNELPDIINLNVKIVDMKIEKEVIEFTLSFPEDKVTVSSNREYLTICGAENGLLIESGGGLWSILLPTNK
jgi:hypothetical protein